MIPAFRSQIIGGAPFGVAPLEGTNPSNPAHLRSDKLVMVPLHLQVHAGSIVVVLANGI
jgi:hypothetical protein